MTPAELDALIERLKDMATEVAQVQEDGSITMVLTEDATCTAAAAALAELRAEVARLAERILSMLAVIEAAKALRPYVIPITLNGISSKPEIAAFDAALAKLGELK